MIGIIVHVNAYKFTFQIVFSVILNFATFLSDLINQVFVFLCERTGEGVEVGAKHEIRVIVANTCIISVISILSCILKESFKATCPFSKNWFGSNFIIKVDTLFPQEPYPGGRISKDQCPYQLHTSFFLHFYTKNRLVRVLTFFSAPQ